MIKMTQDYFIEQIKLDLFDFETSIHLETPYTYEEWIALFLTWINKQDVVNDNASLKNYKTIKIQSEVKLD